MVLISKEDALNQILSSIAMEELGLSHILNAEGEKIQYALGTLYGVSGPGATIEDVLEINDSVSEMLQNMAQYQEILKGKLDSAVEAYNEPNPGVK